MGVGRRSHAPEGIGGRIELVEHRSSVIGGLGWT